jgi:hypothetical protein
MARIALTEALAQEILQAQKIVDEDMIWQTDLETNYFKATAVARVGLRIPLKVHMNANKSDPTKISVTLVVSGAYPIFRLDVNGSHQNRHTDAGRWHRQTHKHRWTDNCRDAFAYTPIEVIPNDPEGVFREFCAEANIEFRGHVGNFPAAQLELI